MDVGYWNTVAASYDDQVFNSVAADTTGVLRQRLDELAAPDRVACDFGCGVGHYLPLLAPRFGRVVAIDFASDLLARAREQHAGLGNVEFVQADLARGRRELPRAHVGFCTNVLIHPDAGVRRAILRRIRTQLVGGGRLLALVPSTESMLYSAMQLAAWTERDGVGEPDSVRSGLQATARSATDLLRGVLLAGGVRTKCYLREEAEVLFRESGFRLRSADKLEFPWSEELEDPPAWLGPPLPWEWLFVLEKQANGPKTRISRKAPRSRQ
jgi:SAM-dependent methyltransferase